MEHYHRESAHLIEEHAALVESACSSVHRYLKQGFSFDYFIPLVVGGTDGIGLRVVAARNVGGDVEMDLELQPEGMVKVLMHLGGHGNAQRHWHLAREAQ